MTREQYIKNIFDTYSLVSVMADKNDCKTMRLRHKKLGKDVVLHSLQKPAKAYELLCGIIQDNLPEVYDTVELADGQIVLEEYIEGLTVAQVMESGKYSKLGVRRVIKAVCAALDVLHGHNIVHRDIKPENIIIGKNGRVVLIDFNASRQTSLGSRDTEIMGTVGYASPEQLGITQSDARTDIYAVGVLMNVMLTGKHPSEKIAGGYYGHIIKKCTSVNPNDRYQTAAKLSNAL